MNIFFGELSWATFIMVATNAYVINPRFKCLHSSSPLISVLIIYLLKN